MSDNVAFGYLGIAVVLLIVAARMIHLSTYSPSEDGRMIRRRTSIVACVVAVFCLIAAADVIQVALHALVLIVFAFVIMAIVLNIVERWRLNVWPAVLSALAGFAVLGLIGFVWLT